MSSLRRALVDEHPRAQHDDVVAHPLDLAHVVRREQHRAAGAVLVALEVRAHPVADVRIERGRRLVEKQHVGLVQHGLCERDAGPLACRQAAVRTLQQPGEIAVLGDFGDSLARAAQSVEIGKNGEVLRDGQPLRQIDVRRREVHPREHPVPLRRHVLAQHGDAPGARRQHAEQHRQRRRLAGPVTAEQRGRRAGAHGERDALDRFDGAVGLGEIGDDDRGVGALDQHWIVWRQYCASSLTTVVPPIGRRALPSPYSIASLNSYLRKNASNCSAPSVPTAAERVLRRVVLEEDRRERLRRRAGHHAGSGSGIVDAVLGAAMDRLRDRVRRGLALVADERDVARRIRELVRANRGERNDRASRADAAAPLVRRAVLALERGRRFDGAAELEKEARRADVRVLEDVVGLVLQVAHAQRRAVRVDERGALVEPRSRRPPTPTTPTSRRRPTAQRRSREIGVAPTSLLDRRP